MQNIHCCNNADLPANDKFAKLRPLFDILDKKFINMSPYEESHAIDESMVPYFGQLRIMGLKGTGTIRENRVGKACPLSRSTEMRKKERGAIEFVSSDTNTISLCKWHDNSVVAIASNHTKILPTLPVKRFCRKEKNDLCSATTCNKNV
nr:unnamed protein product [Callosobruchus analis]